MHRILVEISKVTDGNMSYMLGNPKEVTNNRKKFLGKYGIRIDQCSGAFLKHSKRVVVAKHKGILQRDYEVMPKVDGLVTNEKNRYLFMTFGDCLLIILHDPINSAIGLIHAGWKGTDTEIARVAVRKLVRLYKSDPKEMKAIIGPSIRKESYIFENPIRIEKGSVHNPKWHNYCLKIKENLYAIDLVQFNIDLLIDSGVEKINIADMGIDTAQDTRYFSHYRDSRSNDGDTERFASVIGLN